VLLRVLGVRLGHRLPQRGPARGAHHAMLLDDDPEHVQMGLGARGHPEMHMAVVQVDQPLIAGQRPIVPRVGVGGVS
jgi:hypothetical protein